MKMEFDIITDKGVKISARTLNPIQPFQNFLLDAWEKEVDGLEYLTNIEGRGEYVEESEQEKVQKVLDKLDADELPLADGLEAEHSQVGSFIPTEDIEEIYDEEAEEIIHQMKEGDILVYYWNTPIWWQKKGGKEDGLVRIK